MNKRIAEYYSLIIVLMAILTFSCRNEKVDPSKECKIPLPDTVSFSKNIVPIFTAHCSKSGCHQGTSPEGNLNLEPASAYKALMRKGSGYIDTLNPERSVLYISLVSEYNPMPPDGKLDDCSIELILNGFNKKQ